MTVVQFKKHVTHGGATVVPIEQRSPEWFEWRRGKATASDAPVIMGAAADWSKVQTWDDLRIARAGLEADPDPFMAKAREHGNRVEPEARRIIAPHAPPVCLEAADARFTASLDGWIDGRFWLELKCPYSGERSKVLRALAALHPSVGNDRIDVVQTLFPWYWWQLVHQAGVLQDPSIHAKFAVFGDGSCFEVVEIPAAKLLEDWPRLKAEWERFLAGEPQNPPTDSDQWQEAAKRYKIAKDDLDMAQQALAGTAEALRCQDATENLRQATEALLAAGEGEGHGIRVETKFSGGQVSWKGVAEALWQEHGEGKIGNYADGFRSEKRESLVIKED